MPPALPVPPPSGEFQIFNNIDIHASQEFSAPPRPSGPRMPNMPGGRQQTRPRSGSSGPFYLKGTCTFGKNSLNKHRQPQLKPIGGGYRAAGPQCNQNRGGGSLRGRFNPPANKAPFNSSSQNSNTAASQDQDNYYRSRKRNDDDFNGSRRHDRSPSPSRGRRRSRSNSPERYHRSRSPHSHSSSHFFWYL